METLKIESERSTVGLVIELGLLLFISTRLMSWTNTALGVLVFILWLSKIIYIYWTAKSRLTIENKLMTLQVTNGIPAQTKIIKQDLNNVLKLTLHQSHNSIIGGKFILIETSDTKEKVDVPFRYHQLVKIQDFLNTNTELNVQLIG